MNKLIESKNYNRQGSGSNYSVWGTASNYSGPGSIREIELKKSSGDFDEEKKEKKVKKQLMLNSQPFVYPADDSIEEHEQIGNLEDYVNPQFLRCLFFFIKF